MKIENVVKKINICGRTQTVTVEFVKSDLIRVKGTFTEPYEITINNEDLFYLLNELCVNEIQIINKYNS